MYEIQLSNNQQRLPIHDASIKEMVHAVLQAEEVADAEIGIAFVDDAAIHVINRKHLQHDYPTDVISFLYESTPPPMKHPRADALRGAGFALEGEVVISTETAIREACEYGWASESELQLYLVHGLLHLCGYDDLTELEQQLMRARERAILQIWNLSPHYTEWSPKTD